jgi:antirestriction protein
MGFEVCPECVLLWDQYRDCVSKIHHIREAAEIALRNQDQENANVLQDELYSLLRKSAQVKKTLEEHQRAFHHPIRR